MDEHPEREAAEEPPAPPPAGEHEGEEVTHPSTPTAATDPDMPGPPSPAARGR